MLQIIKASAGSGKTYRLTEEYIKLLFENDANYRHILAVTFTNKATEEMKSRIVKELFLLADGQDSSYLPTLIATTTLSEKEVRTKACKLLSNILHDYSNFFISTIDKFFQQVIRTFSKDVGLQGGYNIELDTKSVLSLAVDRLIFDLEKETDKELLNWLVGYAIQLIEEGEGWNPKKNITQLSNELLEESFRENEQEIKEKIKDRTFLREYRGELHVIKQSHLNNLKATGKQGVGIMTACGFDPAESSRGILKHFEGWAMGGTKEPPATFIAMQNNIDKWCAKSKPKEIKEAAERCYAAGLNDCISRVIELFENNTQYHTANEILRNLPILGILSDLNDKLRQVCGERNLLMISDTNELINRIIDGSDAPFIYERTGARIRNFMIDEFQDTSSLQWKNFKPLIEESLSSGGKSLIVGDVKQSIYRWRNSDWSLLGAKLQQEISQELFKVDVLETNYRSEPIVVGFNNAIMKRMSGLLNGMFQTEENRHLSTSSSDLNIKDAYADVEQKINPKKTEPRGHIHIRFIEKEKAEAEGWKQKALEQTITQIESLQAAGYRLKEIGILVRKKDEGAMIASRLIEKKAEQTPGVPYAYEFISDEALLIRNSRAVEILVAVLKHCYRPNLSYCRLMLRKEFDQEKFDRLEEIKQLPLYELCEAIIRLFELNRKTEESVYLQSFLDLLLDYTMNNSPDTGRFVQWWDEYGIKKTLAGNPEQNAMSILTIHKSKGLEFKAVIIPFADWDFDHSSSHNVILWCRPTTAPFNRLPVLPVLYSKRLGNTIFANDYRCEQQKAFIDNLNIAYVAFTRACEALIIMTPKPSGSGESVSLSKILYSSIEASVREKECINNVSLADGWNEEEQTLTVGSLRTEVKPTTESKAPLPLSFESIPTGNRLCLLLNSRGFFNDKRQRAYGTVMHNILSRVTTTEDIEKAVDYYVEKGELSIEERTQAVAFLREKLEGEEVKEWFMPNADIKTEAEILLPSSIKKRPDRVICIANQWIIVDYKFGEAEEPSHVKQVKQYINLVKEMGHTNVKGYLWYLHLDKIVECC